jgi:hypothetical protein
MSACGSSRKRFGTRAGNVGNRHNVEGCRVRTIQADDERARDESSS